MDPHDLTLDTLDVARWNESIEPPDVAARAAARDRQHHLAKPTGALGRLEEVSVWLAGVAGRCPPPPLERAGLAIFAGDHGVARTARTSAYPPEVTAQMVAAFVAGGAAATVLAGHQGVSVRVVDVSVDIDWAGSGLDVPAVVWARRVRRGSGSIDREDALSVDEAVAALRLGADLADELVDAGAQLVVAGDMGIGNTTPAAALVGVLADLGPVEVVGRGTGIDDLTWMRKTAAVRDAMRRGRAVRNDPVRLLATCGGADFAAITGFLLQAAARRTPALLDGVVACACALVAQAIAPTAAQWWLAGHRSTEPAAVAALDRLGLEPLVDLGMRLGEGTGALVALPIVRAAGDLLREMATFDSAGVSDRAPESGDDAPVSAAEAGPDDDATPARLDASTVSPPAEPIPDPSRDPISDPARSTG